MRRNSRVIRLAAVATVLSILVMLGFLFPESARSGSAAQRDRFIEPKAAARVETIEIAAGDFKTGLVRCEGVWYLETKSGFLPVRQGRVESLLHELAKHRKMEKVATGEKAMASLGLDGENAWRLTLKAADHTSLADIRFGFTDASGDSVFVRIGTDKESCRTDTGAFRMLGRKKEDWLDYAVVDPLVFTDKLQSIEVWTQPVAVNRLSRSDTLPSPAANPSLPARHYSVVRNGQGWILGAIADSNSAIKSPGAAANPDITAREIVSAIFSLEASGFRENDGGEATDRNPSGLSTGSVGRIMLRMGDGSALALEISATADPSVLEIRIAGREWVYLMTETSLAPILREAVLN